MTTLTAPEAAKTLGIWVSDLRDLAAADQVQCWRTPGGHLRFDADYVHGLAEREAGRTPVPSGFLQPCGSEAAYQRHMRSDRDPCEPCLAANRRAKAIALAKMRGHATTGGAGTILRVAETTIARWCDEGALVATRTAGGHRRVTWASIAAQLEAGAP